MKTIKYLSIVILFFASSCSKIVDVSTPYNVLYPSAVFADSSAVKAAVLGLYSGVLNTNTYNFELTVLNSLYADETTSISYPTYLANSVSPSDTQLGSLWTDNYSNIYRANAIIEGVQSSSLFAGTKQQATGEALFMRALCHFNLVNTFGNVPLITTTNATINATAPQSAQAVVYQQIIADLKQAVAYLPANYTISSNERTRINKYAAIAMLSKVYLYTQDWTNAEAQASLLIGNPLFNLPADLTKVFLNTSTEAIFQFDNKPTGYTSLGSLFVPTAGVVPAYTIRPELLNAFETGDQRKANWIAVSAGYFYPAKYKARAVSTTSEYLTLLRLGEIYLIRAEARAEENNVSGSQSDLNAVRNRAGLGNTSASGQTSLLTAIEQERRVELFCEWGNRFYDLKRTGRINTVLSTEKPGWKSTAANYPIPSVELGKNVNLKQNIGYN